MNGRFETLDNEVDENFDELVEKIGETFVTKPRHLTLPYRDEGRGSDGSVELTIRRLGVSVVRGSRGGL